MRNDVDQRIVTTASGVEHGHPVGDATLCPVARLALEDHDDGFGNPSRTNRRSHLVHEGTGCSRPVPPPARGTGSDHVGRINEKHDSSLITEAEGNGEVPWFRLNQAEPER